MVTAELQPDATVPPAPGLAGPGDGGDAALPALYDGRDHQPDRRVDDHPAGRAGRGGTGVVAGVARQDVEPVWQLQCRSANPGLTSAGQGDERGSTVEKTARRSAAEAGGRKSSPITAPAACAQKRSAARIASGRPRGWKMVGWRNRKNAAPRSPPRTVASCCAVSAPGFSACPRPPRRPPTHRRRTRMAFLLVPSSSMLLVSTVGSSLRAL